MPQVRAVYKEHSGDLTPNDVARSIGYLEGLLYTSIRQRGVLSKAVQNLKALKMPMVLVSNFVHLAEGHFSWVSDVKSKKTKSMQPNLRWLTAMLKTGAEIICAQANLGKIKELDLLALGMREWAAKLLDLANSFEHLPILPPNVLSDEHEIWEQSARLTIADIQNIFTGWIDNNAVATPVLRQIHPFVFDFPEIGIATTFEGPQTTLENHAKHYFDFLDQILGSMQDVAAALKALPASTEEAAWLITEEQAVSNALSALHSLQITSELQRLLDNVQSIGDDAGMQIIAALFASVRPILDQYVASYTYLVNYFDSLHTSTTSLLYRLSKSFIQIGTQGFCQPPEKSADQQQGKDEKLESGTGLGEGEGAEDISKDIEDDEDLEDLAQEKGGEREGSIEEEENAVDMGEQEMEGETEEVGEKEDKGEDSGEEGEEDVQSEVGSVDDLGPSAVDEKMWDDGGKDEDAKEQEGKQNVGTKDEIKK